MEKESKAPQAASKSKMAESISAKELLMDNKVYFMGLFLFLSLAGFLLLTTEQGEVEFLLNRYRSPSNDGLWGFLTQLAEEYVYFIIIVVLAAVSYRKALAFGVIALLVPTTSGALKALFGAPRPMRWFYDFAPDQWAELFRFPEVASTWSYTSFPSGHATSAFAIYGFLAFCAVGRSKHGLGLLCILAAISVAISRQYLLFHFLKDVVAGALLGTLIATGVYLWQQSWWPDSALAKRGFLNKANGKV